MKTKSVVPGSTMVLPMKKKKKNEKLIRDNLILIRNITDALDILAGNIKTEALIQCSFNLLVFIYHHSTPLMTCKELNLCN